MRAILTDPEARGDVKLDPGYGKLREPVLFMAAAARAVGTPSPTASTSAPPAAALGQNLFYPPSVFNYYPPDYVLPGTARSAPEFAIQNSSTYINRDNVVEHARVRQRSRRSRPIPARRARSPTGRRCGAGGRCRMR